MVDILQNTIFISDCKENIEYSVQYVKQLHQLILQQVLKLQKDNSIQITLTLSTLFEQLRCIMFD